MRKILALFLSLLWVAPASAQIVGTLPFTLQNGTIADANQVMSDLNTIVAAVNANAANAGANTNISALNGLTTPLTYTSGGTSLYIGGASSNVGNAYTIASPIPTGYTLTTGKVVSFIASAQNTGAATLNVAGLGALALNRQTPAGESPMVGGEITLGQVILAYYDGADYECLNCTQTGVVPTGTVIDWVGAGSGPAGYVRADGTAYSRTTLAILFNTISVTGVAATTTSGNTSVVVPNSTLFQIGWFAGGSNVTCNSTIASIPDGTHVVINNAAGASGATTLTIGPYPQGDCSTTFNVPDLRGRATTMRDTTGTILTSATCPNPATIGTVCGWQTQTLVTANLPPYTPSGSISVTGNVALSNTPGFNIVGGGTVNVIQPGGSTSVGITSQTFTGNAQGGTSTPVADLPPVGLVDKYIKT